MDILISEEEEEYVYEDVDISNIKQRKDDGSRLVGARAAIHATEAPFLVALNPFRLTRERYTNINSRNFVARLRCELHALDLF